VYTMKYRRYKSSSYTQSSYSQHCQQSAIATFIHSSSSRSSSISSVLTASAAAKPVAATTAAVAARSCSSISRSSSACALTASTARQACAGHCLLRTLHCCCCSALKLLLYCKLSTAAQRFAPTVCANGLQRLWAAAAGVCVHVCAALCVHTNDFDTDYLQYSSSSTAIAAAAARTHTAHVLQGNTHTQRQSVLRRHFESHRNSSTW
jgi:hypothetical protein